jgi:hypothetical protein
MAGAGIRSFSKFRGPLTADCHNRNDILANRSHMDCGMPTTTLQYTVECQLLGKIWPRNATNRVTVLSPWHSAVHIWARNLAKDWIPAPAILHRKPPCLLRHKFLTLDFPGVSPIRGELFRFKLYTKGLRWHSISWYYPFNLEGLNVPSLVDESIHKRHLAVFIGKSSILHFYSIKQGRSKKKLSDTGICYPFFYHGWASGELKETVSRDFRPPFFFINRWPLGPW